jgi:hypothetical protein
MPPVGFEPTIAVLTGKLNKCMATARYQDKKEPEAIKKFFLTLSLAIRITQIL